MKVSKKDLLKNSWELTIELAPEEVHPFLEKAALRLAQKAKIPGFRPGKAPYALVQKQLGEMAIYEEALDSILTHGFYRAVQEEKLLTVGQPEIKLEKFAPGNPIVFSATIALLPELKLGDWKKLAINKKLVAVKNEDLEKTLAQLQEMQVKETISGQPAQTGDKVEIDFEVYLNKAIVEGGKNSRYPVIIGQNNMIPGFEEKLIGHKAGEELEFSLKFPDKYFQNNLAGRMADFKVKITGIYSRQLPELNDAFAKNIGLENMAKLREQLQKNIQADLEQKETQRAENEALQAVVAQTTFEEMPDKLLENEIHKMIHELEHSLKQRGLDLNTYLQSIKKTPADLRRDFGPQAKERVKAALVLRALAQTENISSTPAEIEGEIKKQTEFHKDNSEAWKNIQHPDYKNHLANMITNQKVIKLISDTIIK